MTDELVGDRIIEQLEVIEELRKEFAHGIRVEQEAVVGQPETWQYTCFQYALGWIDPPRPVWVIANAFPDVYPSPDFMAFLVDNHLEEVTRAQAQDGDLVIYSDESVVRHAGILRGREVVSKWGTVHLWLHGTQEVPQSYGDAVRYFRPISPGEATQAFVDYAVGQLGIEALEPYIVR